MNLVRYSLVSLVLCVVCSCSTSKSARSSGWESKIGDGGLPQVTPKQLLAECRIKTDLIRSGTVGRKYYRPMTPKYITIHSTQNYTGNAYQHALALKRGALRANKATRGQPHRLSSPGTSPCRTTSPSSTCRAESKASTPTSTVRGTTTASASRCASTAATTIGRTIDRTATLAAYLM